MSAALAVLILRTDLPGRRLFEALVWVTLFAPSDLVVWAWELLYTRCGCIDGAIALPARRRYHHHLLAGRAWMDLVAGDHIFARRDS